MENKIFLENLKLEYEIKTLIYRYSIAWESRSWKSVRLYFIKNIECYFLALAIPEILRKNNPCLKL